MAKTIEELGYWLKHDFRNTEHHGRRQAVSYKRPIDCMRELLERHDVTYRNLNDNTVRYVTRYGVVVAREEDGAIFAYYADADGIRFTTEQAHTFAVVPDRDATMIARQAMSKFIVEIRDDDIKEWCAGCPMNYDYVQCTASYGIDDPLLEWLWDGRKNERPKNCPLIPYEEM